MPMRPLMMLIPLAALTAGACTEAAPEARYTRDKARLARLLAGRVAGEPVNCIFPTASSGGTIYGDDTIIYRDGARLWRTGPVGACPGLRPDVILVIDRFGSQLCRNDRFRTVDRGVGIPSGDCRFDSFTPYTRAK
ncbi:MULTISPECIES: hypothetical protein [unclassified Sphingomonas]|jgi:hypothetical protein|uniref:hypothetical protein n=2 Tax=unclassified Sphingomonas TaxID=196159 RepID=UPI000A6C2AF3|nr:MULTISPECIES: hypothetical protein [unclassified Sphingomonas]